MDKLKPIRLGVVIPCYNEEEVLPETIKRMLDLFERMSSKKKICDSSSIYFIDDGSKDSTWNIIDEYAEKDPRVSGIKLSRNMGHQSALIAGLLNAEGDALISIDADLQDDVGVIEQMVDKFRDGKEIVYGVRKSRETDSFFKRSTAQAYYRILNLLGVDVIYNHADYRLLSRKAIDCLGSFSEVNIFLRGIVPLMGFSTDTVEYDRAERFAGESKYPIGKMLALAVEGVTSFSTTPLRLISTFGFLICFFSLLMIAWILVGSIFLKTVLPGWASSTIAIYFLGGVQLLSIGVVGEYVSKIYLETKRRPRYFIEKTV